MKLVLAAVSGCLVAFTLAAQQTGPALSIDASSDRHAISPDIYGISFYWNTGSNPVNPALAAAAPAIRPTVRRWGGNSTSTYNWQFDVDNIDADWFYEVLPDATVDASKLPAGSTFNAFADQARITGGKILATMPILGWLPKARQQMCSFNQAKYPNQCKIDPYYQYHPMTCGDGIQYTPACGTPTATDGKAPSNPAYIQNDPTDAYAQYDQTFQAAWVQYLISRYGKGGQGGVAIWSLDNEPIWWDSTHRDIHPNPYTYDEVLSLNTTYAAAIKQADPTALVSGPVADNWSSLFFSKKDIVAGWSSPERPILVEPGGPQRAQRRAVPALVSPANAELRAAARHAPAGYPRHPRLLRTQRPRQRDRIRGQRRAAARFHARILGSHLRRQRRLLDRRSG